GTGKCGLDQGNLARKPQLVFVRSRLLAMTSAQADLERDQVVQERRSLRALGGCEEVLDSRASTVSPRALEFIAGRVDPPDGSMSMWTFLGGRAVALGNHGSISNDLRRI